MSNVGFATLSVIPSFQGFQGRLSAGVAGPMAQAGRDGGRKFGDVAGKEAGGRFRSGFAQRMKGFSPFAGIAIGAGAVSLFGSAIDEASALSESGNKIDVIFGSAAETVNDFADAASEGLGQSDLQARNAAATFGVFGKSAGLAGEDLAGFSTDLTALASDLASFYDSTVDEAIDAIGSGLRGEAEPLRRFGVLLDDATLRQEALKQGLIETTKDALTPQQKVLSAQAVIMAQTADAQGDFARTSDGLANSQRDLSADWADMKAELGEGLLPAMTATVGVLKDDMLPALRDAGGVAKDVAGAFNDLPTPVKASAAAFVALRLASATGFTSAVLSGVQRLGSGMDSLRLRTMLATDAFRTARAGTLEFTGNTGRYVAPVGRFSAALQGLGAAATGAGSSIRRGLSGAMGLIGGPWGAALIGGTAILTKFWTEHREAKQQVDELAASLDKQTGALTTNSREWAVRALTDSGALDAARELGINLEMVTDAALGDAAAMEQLRDAIRGAREAGEGGVATDLIREVSVMRGVVDEGSAEWQLMAEAMGDAGDAAADAEGAIDGSATATRNARDAAADYATQLKAAKDRLEDLIDKEQERRETALQNRRDQLALLTTLQDTREELNEGKKTLNENTKAGQENLSAIYDLADQWNRSGDAVRNQKGAYRDFRKQFVELATAMGGGSDSAAARARELADEILNLPDKKALKITTPGMDKALADVRLLTKLAAPGGVAFETKLLGDSYPGRAAGGPVNAGYPYWVGEKGPELIVPRQAGTVLTADQSAAVSSGVKIEVGTVVAHDYDDFTRQMQERARRAASDGIRN